MWAPIEASLELSWRGPRAVLGLTLATPIRYDPPRGPPFVSKPTHPIETDRRRADDLDDASLFSNG